MTDMSQLLNGLYFVHIQVFSLLKLLKVLLTGAFVKLPCFEGLHPEAVLWSLF